MMLMNEHGLIWMLFLVLLSFVLGLLRGTHRKINQENSGEALVRRKLIKYCRSTSSHVLNNITIPLDDGTTQIDHVLVTNHGILVIETKHYSGWIFANDRHKVWTQVKFKLKNKFQNPIFQNYKHLMAVRRMFDFLPEEYIQSLVVFTGEAEFRTDMPTGVIYVSDLEKYVNSMSFGVISENRVQFCVGRLECKRMELTNQTDIEHQAYLDKKFGRVDE